MKTRTLPLALAVLFMLLISMPMVRAQGTAFTYQGRLDLNGAVASGEFDLRFGLYTNSTSGNLIGNLVTNANTAVSNGLFTVTLNFSNAFNGTPYWLEIGVRTNGSTDSFTTLAPRQSITPAPYAIMAASASNLLGTLPATQLSGQLPASSISGLYSNAVSFTNTGNVFTGNGTGLTGLVTPTQGNFFFAYDTSVQNITTANTFQSLLFNTANTINGWSLSSSHLFTTTQTGLYLVEYQVHFQNASANSPIAIVRALLSGVEIVGSEAAATIPPNYGIALVSKSFLVPMSAGQILSFQFTGNLAAPYLYTVTATFPGTTSAFQGASVNVIRLQ